MSDGKFSAATRGHEERLVKVYFALTEPGAHEGTTESLWAKPITASADCCVFEIRNYPFSVYGISFLDIVRAVKRVDGAGYDFAGVVDRAGHSTYRLHVPKAMTAEAKSNFERSWALLEELGCTYESTSEGDKALYVIDVPKSTNVHQAYKIFDESEKAGIWVFEEAHCGHPV